MKLRSTVLFACLLVVPLLAMFSHKIPRGFRTGFRDRIWQPVVDRMTAWNGGESSGEGKPAVVGPLAATPPGSVVAIPKTPVPSQPLPAAAGPLPAPVPAPAAVSSVSQVDVLPTVNVQATPLPAEPFAADGQSRFGDSVRAASGDAKRATLDARLVDLGAVGVLVKATDSASGVTIASCRVAADASGQLQRLFQASGPTEEGALERLAEQVSAWKTRLAAQPPASGEPSGEFVPQNPSARPVAPPSSRFQ